MITITRIILFLITGQCCSLNAGDAASKYLFLEQVNDICMIAPMSNLKRLEYLKTTYPQAFGRALTEIERKQSSPHSLFQKHIPTAEYATKRTYFGRAHAGTMKFYQLLKTGPINAAEPTPFYQFIRRGIEQAPIMPHFYLADGIDYIPYRKKRVSDTLANTQSYLKLIYSPYFLIDTEAAQTNELANAVEHIESLSSVALPIGVINSGLKAFSTTTESYEPLGISTPKAMAHKVKEQIRRAQISTLEHKEAFIASLQEQYPMWNPLEDKTLADGRYLRGAVEANEGFTWLRPLVQNYGLFWSEGAVLGIKEFAFASETGSFGYPQNSTKRYSTYMHGLGKLIYLRLGINYNNEPLREDAPDELERLAWQASQDLTERSQPQEGDQPANCWWSNDHLSRDKFLNYQIAELFRRNLILKQKAMGTVDFGSLKPWAAYDEFMKDMQAGLLYRHKAHRIKKGKRLSPINYNHAKYFVPGEEQALAACVLGQIRDLSYAALGEKAFYEAGAPELGNAFRRFLIRRIFGLDFNHARYLDQAQKKVTFTPPNQAPITISFVTVWNEILTELKLAHPERTDWICFDFHGWVLSWDPFLVALQREHLMKTAKLKSSDKRVHILDNMGVAVIESWLSNKFNAFYVKKG
ncbi:hypothetical protein FJ365_03115 [Candidatus Dependentiae bacterium]|nr:hypothetical protein [Candidatus Dependentiae bacterium]